MLYLRLFFEFMKIGLFSVGGGLATLPFLRELAVNTGWFTEAQLADMLAVSESTPGPIGINMATYVGFTIGGVPGAIISTLGLITPSIIIILLIALFLKNFSDNKYVKGAFYGLRPTSTGLIAAAGLSVAYLVFINPLFAETHAILDLLNWKAVVLAAALITLTRFVKQTKKLHPIVFIAASALIGIIFKF
ncbi:MAG: chromate transporter [Firmicutes bacterium]|nr:chromate transporter [Bacillota bacterium]